MSNIDDIVQVNGILAKVDGTVAKEGDAVYDPLTKAVPIPIPTLHLTFDNTDIRPSNGDYVYRGNGTITGYQTPQGGTIASATGIALPGEARQFTTARYLNASGDVFGPTNKDVSLFAAIKVGLDHDSANPIFINSWQNPAATYGNTGVFFLISPSPYKLRLAIKTDAQAFAEYDSPTIPDIRDGLSHDVAWTVDRDALVSFYFDGVLLGTQNVSAHSGTITASFIRDIINAAEFGGYVAQTNFILDEWSRWEGGIPPLTAAQVEQLHKYRVARTPLSEVLSIPRVSPL